MRGRELEAEGVNDLGNRGALGPEPQGRSDRQNPANRVGLQGHRVQKKVLRKGRFEAFQSVGEVVQIEGVDGWGHVIDQVLGDGRCQDGGHAIILFRQHFQIQRRVGLGERVRLELRDQLEQRYFDLYFRIYFL